MTFLDKLDWLMSEHGLNKRSFSLQSGIPYTTVDGFYKKGYENAKVSTLKKVAQYFNVTLDFLILDEEQITADMYNGEEKALVRSWRQADEKTKRKVAIDLEDYGFTYIPKEKEAEQTA